MAGLTRLELATFRVTGGRSNQLSYNPIIFIIHQFALGSNCFTDFFEVNEDGTISRHRTVALQSAGPAYP
jgi:hypothetical protein